MSLHTTEEWARHAVVNMTQAQHAQHRAGRQCDDSRRAHDGTVVNNLNMYDHLYQAMVQKVKTTHRLVEKLQNRSNSIENSIHQTQSSLAGLERALFDKESPMQLCAWRLEQREKRPLREQVRDSVEVALEEEKATLVETQRRLSEAIKRTKGMLGDLNDALKEVRNDIEQKMQALTVDEMCLRSTERSMHAVEERTPRPHSAGHMRGPPSLKMSRHQVAMQETSRNEVQRQQDAERLSRSAAAREDAAKALRDENARLAQRCESAANEAAAKSERRLQERIHENQQMRRALETEIRETQGKMDYTKNTISETKYQIKALQEPIDLTSACASWRKQRATKEYIADPVTTTLQEHRMVVLQAHQDLVSHHQSEKGNLKELHDRRSRLKEDLRDKTAALHIDLNCLTHEALRLNGRPWPGVSKSKLSKAIRMESSFVPGAMTAR